MSQSIRVLQQQQQHVVCYSCPFSMLHPQQQLLVLVLRWLQRLAVLALMLRAQVSWSLLSCPSLVLALVSSQLLEQQREQQHARLWQELAQVQQNERQTKQGDQWERIHQCQLLMLKQDQSQRVLQGELEPALALVLVLVPGLLHVRGHVQVQRLMRYQCLMLKLVPSSVVLSMPMATVLVQRYQ